MKLVVAGIRKIDPEVYQALESTHFGSETVSTVQLCAMFKPKQDKYYHVEYQVPF